MIVWFFSSHFLTCYLKVLDEIYLHHLRYIVIFSSIQKDFSSTNFFVRLRAFENLYFVQFRIIKLQYIAFL